MKIPEPLHNVAALVDRQHEENQGKPRTHFGLSMCGHHCERYLWLNFRWAVIQKFSGRMLRLFRRGHLEEITIVDDLRSAGLEITNTGATQARVDFGGHVSGSMDGRIERGVPGAATKPHLLEIKTHNDKSFKDLSKKGVKESKPMHWAQMQAYMLGSVLENALYVAINKNDDSIYTERLKIDVDKAEKLVERACRIATSDRMPAPISTDKSWYQCKMCPMSDFCHDSKTTKEVNCRTCAHSTAKPNSTWHCARWDDTIPEATQRTGCEAHVLHPDLVPWDMGEPVGDWTATYNGVPNGEDGFSSSELLANFEACKNSDKFTQALRQEFGAKVVKK